MMSCLEDNLASQADEVEALKAIYEDEFVSLDIEGHAFEFRVCCEEDKEKWWSATVDVILPETYPSTDPPIAEIYTECLSPSELNGIDSELQQIWEEEKGSNILYNWIEKIRELITEKYEAAKATVEVTADERNPESFISDTLCNQVENAALEEVIQETLDVPCPEIMSGEPFTVKKSTFQGHAAQVHTMKEVKCVLRKLKENRKIANATHNIVAYRLPGVNETSFIQDYSDDGETHAGGRLLHLLQILDVKNIVVVVSRWFGGVLLGPDRFRLINNAGREVLIAGGFYNPDSDKHKVGKKSKPKKR